MSHWSELCEELSQQFRPEILDVVPLDIWESRVDVAVRELIASKILSPQILLQRPQQTILIYGSTDLAQDERLLALGQTQKISSSEVACDARLYVLENFTDLSYLRRLKDYPDETPRDALESAWGGVCEEAAAMVLVASAMAAL